MSARTNLPPQAYTRETLTSAFNWLQTQPESVRKLATTPDSLVCLFARAQRGDAPTIEVEAPVSGAAFMSNLKNLAEGLRQLEVPQGSSTGSTAGLGAVAAGAPGWSNPSMSNSMNRPTTAAPAPVLPMTGTSSTPKGGLNERCQAMIQEVKAALNLSSDAEVTNLMVSLAYKNLKELLP